MTVTEVTVLPGPQLMLGSGKMTDDFDGLMTLDANPNVYPDYVAEIPPLPDEVKAEPWSLIMAFHFIEHLFRWQAAQLLGEIREALAPGGVMWLEQPNLARCAEFLLGIRDIPQNDKIPPENYHVSAIYGDQRIVGRNDYMIHRYGYTPASLAALCIEAGWSKDELSIGEATTHAPERDFMLLGCKNV